MRQFNLISNVQGTCILYLVLTLFLRKHYSTALNQLPVSTTNSKSPYVEFNTSVPALGHDAGGWLSTTSFGSGTHPCVFQAPVGVFPSIDNPTFPWDVTNWYSPAPNQKGKPHLCQSMLLVQNHVTMSTTLHNNNNNNKQQTTNSKQQTANNKQLT